MQNERHITNQEYQYMRYLLREYTAHSRRTHDLISSSIELLRQQDSRYYNLIQEFITVLRQNSRQLREVNEYVHNDRNERQSPPPQTMSRSERIRTANENIVRRRTYGSNLTRTFSTPVPIRRSIPMNAFRNSEYRPIPLRSRVNTNPSRLSRLFERLYSVPENQTIDLQNLSPVHIRPTPEQISNATERLVFNTIENPTNSVCPITQQRFEEEEHVIRIIHCGHIYTSASLQQWFQRNTRCPLCRYDIRNYNPMSAIRNPYRNFDTSSNIQNSDLDVPENNENENNGDEDNEDDDERDDEYETDFDDETDNMYDGRILSIIDPSTNEEVQSELSETVIENIRNLIGNDVNNYIRENPTEIDASGALLFEYSFYYPVNENNELTEEDISNNL